MTGAVSAVVALLVLDLLWLSFFMARRYQEMIASIQCGAAMEVRVAPAVVAYFLMCVGLVLIVLPRMEKGRDAGERLWNALRHGGVFGVVLYGVYDATAAAVFKDWSFPLALADVAWGGAVYTAAAYVGASSA